MLLIAIELVLNVATPLANKFFAVPGKDCVELPLFEADIPVFTPKLETVAPALFIGLVKIDPPELACPKILKFATA